MKLFTTQQINDIARHTIEQENITVNDLVERVAEGVTFEIESRWRPGKPVVVFAGCEDNGAEALAVARTLAEHGYHPEVYLINVGGNAINATCKSYRDELLDLDSELYFFHEIVKEFSIPRLTPGHLVVDGLFGAGIREGLKGGYRTLVQFINDSGATIVSIDVPSGMFGDSNPFAVNRDIIHANLTLAIQFPRIAFFNPDNAELVGEWKIIDIGLSETAIRNTPARYHLIEYDEVKCLLKPRPRDCSKANFGAGLLVAGSYGMMGAAVLSARGALRAGVGKLTIESPKCGYQIIQSSAPDALYQY
ncbi:MAG: bifunctional ADP-dependent NAD(P)H-hydrate dehydratase/NAD(P)H-hydrate epimerase, partial [Muribaculaceae bacterium]|nr:bifunctional ADP-dependent NAD(P)H-hydrate dehydratase/NAD(P)H-hydrate epimerase [Muribaculaceae bacterium]